MSYSSKLTGIALATAAAAMFAAAPATAAESNGSGNTVKCMGVNACKGHSSCQTADSSCKGLNSCKGQGFVEVRSAETCEQLGGEVG